MPLGAEDVPEHDRAGGVGEIEAELLGALGHFGAVAAGAAESGEVAFDVGHEDRNADGAEAFGENAQRHRLSRSRRPGDEAMAVRHLGQEADLVGGLRQRKRVHLTASRGTS